MFDVERDERVAGLVIGGRLLLVLGHHHRAAFGAHHDLVLGFLELVRGDQSLAPTRREQRRFVAKRSEEHTSELQSLMRISYAVFCLKKKNTQRHDKRNHHSNDTSKNTSSNAKTIDLPS